MQNLEETVEGTWDEISKLAPKLNGHRLRLTILDSQDTPQVSANLSKPSKTGSYADYLKAERAKFADAPPPTGEELAEAEAEVRDLMNNLNENRRREGAVPFF